MDWELLFKAVVMFGWGAFFISGLYGYGIRAPKRRRALKRAIYRYSESEEGRAEYHRRMDHYRAIIKAREEEDAIPF